MHTFNAGYGAFFMGDFYKEMKKLDKKSENQYRKCALPGCNVNTQHNGGYCCAEHCKQHKELRRRN